MRIDIITIFPDMFDAVLGAGMLRIAREKGLVAVHVHDLRDYASDKRKSVDDRPFGGGPGMVMMVEPIARAVESVAAMSPDPARTFLLTPQGRRFDQALGRELAREKRLILVCGRYEGFDERTYAVLNAEGISIGDYVLTGGELPAMVIVDAVVRLVPGVLGDEESARHESFGEEGMLDFPQYTRPREFRGLKVPDVLLSGDHGKIAEWRREQAKNRTMKNRPDLLNTHPARDDS